MELEKILIDILKNNLDNTYTATCPTTTENPLTYDNLKKTIDEFNKHKIEFVVNPYIEQGKVIILDYEKIREDFGFLLDDSKRGKVIFYNQLDGAILRKYFYQYNFK